MVRRKRDTSDGFDPTISVDASISRPCFEALRLDGILEESTLSPALHQLLLNMARVRNIVSSLCLEDIDVDLDRARQVVIERQSLSPSDRQVLAFAERYAWIDETPRADLPAPSIPLICELHNEVMRHDGELPKDAVGALKREKNVIRDRTSGRPRFHPTPPERVEQELEALFSWFSRVRDRYPPGLVGAIFFAEFQAIHPFRDGNGRLGRLLNALVLKELGHRNVALVPLDGRFFATEDKYYEKLASTNDGSTWHVWSRYYCKQLERAYELADRRADLDPLLKEQAGTVTRNLLEWILQGSGRPFKRGDFPNEEGFSGSALTKALKNLVEKGILEPEGEKKGRTYRLSTGFLEEVYEGIPPVDDGG